MEAVFNVTKEGRKALVKAVSEVTGEAAVYQGAPSFAYAVGGYVIDKDGTLIFNEQTSVEEAWNLLTGLAERGFTFTGEIVGLEPAVLGQGEIETDDLANREAIPEDRGMVGTVGTDENVANALTDTGSDSLLINMPLSSLTESALYNLEKLVSAKAWIIRKMTGADALPIGRDGEHLSFPWFKPNATVDEIGAYSRLVSRLCETASQKQRVMATEKQLAEGDNEKYKARCFLLSLGFIGGEYSSARKILLAPMSGNGSQCSGNGRIASPPSGATAAIGASNTRCATHTAEDAPDAKNAGTNAPTSRKCSDCAHHCYYSEGPMVTGAGDVIDTSKRTPDNYTHYCLSTPRGYRKIKHATDWSGSETAPKWCPLNAAHGSRDTDSGTDDESGIPDRVVAAEEESSCTVE